MVLQSVKTYLILHLCLKGILAEATSDLDLEIMAEVSCQIILLRDLLMTLEEIAMVNLLDHQGVMVFKVMLLIRILMCKLSILFI